MKPIIKYEGGKRSEIKIIEKYIPKEHDRYIEPFFGGGALFFHLQPEKGYMNDISENLTKFYKLTKDNNKEFKHYLYNAVLMFELSKKYTQNHEIELYTVYEENCNDCQFTFKTVKPNKALEEKYAKFTESLIKYLADNGVLFNKERFYDIVCESVEYQTAVINRNKDKEYTDYFVLAVMRAVYCYIRYMYNTTNNSILKTAYFYILRETCYHGAFRVSKKGEMTQSYGGPSYIKKDLRGKVDNLFSKTTQNVLSRLDINCDDFISYLNMIKPTENDFVFLDPPYDTSFSEYEGRPFDKDRQIELRDYLLTCPSEFVLVIKNTDFIYNLYKDNFNIASYDKTYMVMNSSSVDVNSKVEHLLITKKNK